MNKIEQELNQQLEKIKSNKEVLHFSDFKQPITIGISGSFFMKKLFAQINFNPYIGLSVFAFDQYLDQLKSIFKENKINIIIVFQGSKLWKNNEYKSQIQELSGYIKQCWQLLQYQKYDEYQEQLKRYQHYFIQAQEIINLLDKKEIPYIFTPYCQFTQLVYMYDNAYINCIMSEVAILGYYAKSKFLNSLIYDFDLQERKFFWFNFAESLKDTLGLTPQQYQELFLLVQENTFTLKKQSGSNQEVPNLQFILSQIKQKTITSLSQLIENSQVDSFQRQIQMLNSIPHIDDKFKITFNTKEINLFVDNEQMLLGNCLPNIIYIFFSQNLITQQLFELFLFDKFSIQPYFAESFELRSNIYGCWKQMLGQAVCHIIHSLHSTFKSKKYTLQSSFNEEDLIIDPQDQSFLKQFQEYYNFSSMYIPETQSTFIDMLKHYILEQKIQSKPQSRKLSQNLLQQSPKLKALKSQDSNNSSNAKITLQPVLDDKDEIIIPYMKLEQPDYTFLNRTKLNFLDFFNFISLSEKQASQFAKVYKKLDKSFDEELLIILTLLNEKNEQIFNKIYQPFFSYQQIQEKKELNQKFQTNLFKHVIDKTGLIPNLYASKNQNGQTLPNTESLIIISRIFSFIPLNYDKYESSQQMYDGDISCFLELIKQIQFMLRNVFESLVLGYYLQKDNKQELQNILQCKQYMPFRKNYNCGLSIIVVQIASGQKTLQYHKDSKNYPNIVKDIQKGVKFWEQALELIKLASQEFKQLEELYKKFQVADQLIKEKFTDQLNKI